MNRFDDYENLSNEETQPECYCETGFGYELILDSQGVLNVKKDGCKDLIPFFFYYFNKEDPTFRENIRAVYYNLLPCIQSAISKFDDSLESQTFSYPTTFNYGSAN